VGSGAVADVAAYVRGRRLKRRAERATRQVGAGAARCKSVSVTGTAELELVQQGRLCADGSNSDLVATHDDVQEVMAFDADAREAGQRIPAVVQPPSSPAGDHIACSAYGPAPRVEVVIAIEDEVDASATKSFGSCGR
jgi:hypothetical protein